ncbi:O-acetyl-ADP-ribose deacetylase (regulator of RNase III) [Chitinophaga dinghuensis]|uniref:O-acetyl-ADP-ribose deacetylase (Regulator of RNase III) n=1 Tax=Chitinophaga dinghuensis TaxID=1539050 RepID=A0A327W7E6_9BACT|nr:macro domain-containing protein [Chitinophaga dinghuensis]RAJ85388.1 O-acetyl-ADP-ribose deacetylase (regulator of RNase III) [Chitinophaga dinghuensis]
MIQYTTGNLLQATTEALVNAVNTVGVMGKGIALQFKEIFPENFKVYKHACDEKLLDVGQNLVVPVSGETNVKWIINFPTKKHWRHPSKMEYITAGLDDLVKVIAQYKIQSLALPALGCGNGGLHWDQVKPLLEEKLGHLQDVTIVVYLPI